MLLLSSCVKELGDYDADFESVIVVNSVFSPDSLWNIQLSNSISIFGDQQSPGIITNANIRVEDLTENKEIPFEHIENGCYKSTGFKPEAGHHYEVFIDADGYQQAYSTTNVPSISDVSVNTVEELSVLGEKVVRIDLSIEDDPDAKNFYVWELISETDYQKNRSRLFNSADISNVEDVVKEILPNSNDPKDQGNFVFVNDEATDGITGQLNTSFLAVTSPGSTSDGGDSGSNGSAEVNLRLKVRAVSKDLFLYLQSIESYNTNDQINSSVNQAIELYSNITNGWGIFGAFSEKIIDVNN